MKFSVLGIPTADCDRGGPLEKYAKIKMQIELEIRGKELIKCKTWDLFRENNELLLRPSFLERKKASLLEECMNVHK